MRNPTSIEIERCRIAGPSGEPYGQFMVKVGSFRLRCIASCGQGWDHVSVSLANRCPTWTEMDAIKRLFWDDAEIVMQLHISGEKKVNVHPFCLHLWRPQTQEESQAERERWAKEGEIAPEWYFPGEIPLPPKIFV